LDDGRTNAAGATSSADSCNCDVCKLASRKATRPFVSFKCLNKNSGSLVFLNSWPSFATAQLRMFAHSLLWNLG